MELPDLAATEAVGAPLAALVRPGDVITLSGPLGAGKTSSRAGFSPRWGWRARRRRRASRSSSPMTPPEVRLPVFHVDLYRIDVRDEIDELGLDEARRNRLLLVEWPERARRARGPMRWR